MNWISLGRRGKAWKVVLGIVVDVEVIMIASSGGEFAEVEGEISVLDGGEPETSDIVGTDASGSSDGGRSDHVSVLVAAIAIAINFLYSIIFEQIRDIFDTNFTKVHNPHTPDISTILYALLRCDFTTVMMMQTPKLSRFHPVVRLSQQPSRKA